MYYSNHLLPTAVMDNINVAKNDKLVSPPLMPPTMFPTPTTSTPNFTNCNSLFPSPFNIGFQRHDLLRAAAFATFAAPFITQNPASQDVSRTMAQQQLPVPVGMGISGYNSPKEEPPAKRFRPDTGNTCPICGLTLNQGQDMNDHIQEERSQLAGALQNLKAKIHEVNQIELETEDERKSEIERSMKSRYETLARIKLNQRNRFQSKIATFQSFRDRATPMSDGKQDIDDEQKTSPLGTPVTSEVDSFHVSSTVYCKNCEKPSVWLKAHTKCPHLLCAICWNKQLEEPEPCCPVCLTSVNENDLHDICL